eukprot:1705404-Pyramimonas_sp.AAC.1
MWSQATFHARWTRPYPRPQRQILAYHRLLGQLPLMSEMADEEALERPAWLRDPPSGPASKRGRGGDA